MIACATKVAGQTIQPVCAKWWIFAWKRAYLLLMHLCRCSKWRSFVTFFQGYVLIAQILHLWLCKRLFCCQSNLEMWVFMCGCSPEWQNASNLSSSKNKKSSQSACLYRVWRKANSALHCRSLCSIDNCHSVAMFHGFSKKIEMR